MKSFDQFQSIKVNHYNLFSVLRSVTFNFRCHTMFHKVSMRISDVVRKITQKCEEHIYRESRAIPKHQSGTTYSI